VAAAVCAVRVPVQAQPRPRSTSVQAEVRGGALSGSGGSCLHVSFDCHTCTTARSDQPPLPHTRNPHPLLATRSHEQVLKDRRLKRRVEMMAARSAVANLEREVARLREQRAAEITANRRARSEAATAARLAKTRAAMQGWQLGVVRAQHERVLQPEPIEVGALALGGGGWRGEGECCLGAVWRKLESLHCTAVEQPPLNDPRPTKSQNEWQLRNLEQSIKVRAVWWGVEVDRLVEVRDWLSMVISAALAPN